MSVVVSDPVSREHAATLANWRNAPFSRWAFAHVRDIVPVADIAAAGTICDIPRDPTAFPDFAIKLPGGKTLDLATFLAATATDGLAILHNGKLVFELYAGDTTAGTPHIIMSATKSVTGLIAGILADRGQLDLAAPVAAYLPELRDTLYADVMLRLLLDMRAGIVLAPDELRAYAAANGWEPTPAGHSPSGLHAFFEQLRSKRESSGSAFAYVSANTDLLGWAIERATGQRFADLVGTLLWSPMGADGDAYITVAPDGAPRCTGGLCATLRDFARLGQLVVDGGRHEGTQIIPASLIEDISTNGDREAWRTGEFAAGFGGADMSYRSGWYVVHNEPRIMFAMGIHGQNLFVDRAHRIVVAKLSSQVDPLDVNAIGLTHRAVAEFRRCLLADS